MYEDKKRKLKINWKSLLIKMAILLVIIFLIIWIISLFKKDKEVPSNIGDNLKTMQEVANDYFIGSRLPERINGKETLTLKEMLDNKLLLEFKDQDGKSCDENNSYAEVTKVSDNSYTIKVKLVCTKDNDYIIDTFSVDTINNDVNDDENKQDENNSEEDNTGTNTGTSTDNSTSTKPSTTPSQNQTPSTGSSKPSTGSQNTTSSKPSTSTGSQSTSSSKPSSSTGTSTKPSTTPSQSSGSSNQSKPDTETEPPKPSTEPDNDTCMYGSKDYLSIYPLAYEISGKCAVNKDEYLNYAKEVNSIGNAEFKKIKAEISDLAASTNTSLYVENPIYEGVYNISNTGLVGYQIKFVVKQRLTYSTKIIYAYYIDSNGNRKTVTDNRASLQRTDNNLSSGSLASSDLFMISLNTSSKILNVGEVFQLIATTNKPGTISWTSSDNLVATVDSNGVVRALAKGTVTITASVGNYKTSARIFVN